MEILVVILQMSRCRRVYRYRGVVVYIRQELDIGGCVIRNLPGLDLHCQDGLDL